MIKLFWNTHNQNKFNPNKTNKENSRDRKWGLYHKNYSDKWIYEILNKIEFETIQSEKDLEHEDILIIVDSSIENKEELYTKLELICSKMFLIHLGDETFAYDLSMVYNKFNYVWRTFCSNKYFNNKKVSCLPIGYKSGILFKKEAIERKYKWAFLGTPHKSSRHDLLFQLSDIQPSFSHKTKKFDEGIIDVGKMSEILTSTIFIPCPNGFFHPETYRLYEALECECIPIVENAYKYYDRLFSSNPFLKVDMWAEAKPTIRGWNSDQIKKKRQECEIWWSNLKNELQESIKDKIIS